MLSKADKYRQMIQKETKRIKLFPHLDNQELNSTITYQCNIKLPSAHPFRSSQQIEKITQQSLSKQYPISLDKHWPKSCIGLILCEHHQNNQIYYIYGTGILIHKSIVLTSAQNVYCRRLNTQYTNIRFIVGVSDDKCSGINDVMRVHYPNEYTQQEYDDYNFAVLQLYDDLSDSCGFIGWKTMENIQEDEKYTDYGYISDNQEGSFNMRQRMKFGKQQQDWMYYSGSGVLIKKIENKYFIVGLQYSESKAFLSEEIRNIINQWTEITQINLCNHKIGAQGCKYLSQANQTQLTKIDLQSNYIGAQGCKYLTQADWTYLFTINLYDNKIGAQGCKYLIKANWTHLKYISLRLNSIYAQGCKYISQANWKYLNTIDLSDHIILLQGQNSISTQACKYLSQADWIHLTTINLYNNNVGTQGCKYLTQANWIHLNTINLQLNRIDAYGCKYLTQVNWIHLTTINLSYNNIKDIIYRLLLKQSYPKSQIKYD